MPKLTYAEHPVHPVLNDYPAALVPTSVAFDMLHLVTLTPTRSRSRRSSRWSWRCCTGGAAAATGYPDYREIPPKERRPSGSPMPTGSSTWVSWPRSRSSCSSARRAGSGCSSGCSTSRPPPASYTAGWYGQHLVYRHGLRVRGVDPLASAPEAGPDTGKPFAERLESLVDKVPATDLSGYVGQAMTSVGQAAGAARCRREPGRGRRGRGRQPRQRAGRPAASTSWSSTTRARSAARSPRVRRPTSQRASASHCRTNPVARPSKGEEEK